MGIITMNQLAPGEGLRPQVEPQLVEYGELKAIKDAGNLIPGQYYRITDYVTTVNEATITNARSAGHPFDILVRADSASTLNEQAWAVKHEGDTYFKDARLEAWELKYRLDNVQWSKHKGTYVEAPDEVGTASAVDVVTEEGKGTILWMKDEFGNECPYDFKNILFKRWKATDAISGREGLNGLYMVAHPDYAALNLSVDDTEDYIWAYTFSSDNSGGDQTDFSLGGHNVHDNVFKPYGDLLPNNVMFGGDNYGNSFGLNCYYNSWGNFCQNNSWGNGCGGNSWGNSCGGNSWGNDCDNNSWGNSCGGNSWGNFCQNNSWGNDCDNNSWGNSCGGNSWGNSCGGNSWGNDCDNNSWGKSCGGNSWGNSCGGNSWGNGCNNNSWGNSCKNNSWGNYCHNNSWGNNCYSNSWGNSCRNNSWGNFCQNNSWGNECRYNSWGNDCDNNSWGDEVTYSTVFDGVQYTQITTTKVKFVQVLNGVQGTSSSKLTLTFAANKTYTQVAAKTSAGALKIYVPGDLA